MSGAGNPLNYDYRDPRHVERYNKLVIRHPTGETEGKHPRDADVDVMRAIHEPGPLLRVIRAKYIDCSGGSESEARKCTAIGCALWPYRMGSNPFRTREMTQEQREETARRLAAGRARRSEPEQGAAVAEPFNLNGKNEPNDPPATFDPVRAGTRTGGCTVVRPWDHCFGRLAPDPRVAKAHLHRVVRIANRMAEQGTPPSGLHRDIAELRARVGAYPDLDDELEELQPEPDYQPPPYYTEADRQRANLAQFVDVRDLLIQYAQDFSKPLWHSFQR